MEYNFATLFITSNEEYVICISLFHFPYYLSKEQQEGCGFPQLPAKYLQLPALFIDRTNMPFKGLKDRQQWTQRDLGF